MRTLRTKRPTEYHDERRHGLPLGQDCCVATTAYLVGDHPTAQLDMRGHPIFVGSLQVPLGDELPAPQRMGGGPAVVRLAAVQPFCRSRDREPGAHYFHAAQPMVGQSIKMAVAIVALAAAFISADSGEGAPARSSRVAEARPDQERPCTHTPALWQSPGGTRWLLAFLLGFAETLSALNPAVGSSVGSVAATGQTTTVQVKATSNHCFNPRWRCPPVTACR